MADEMLLDAALLDAWLRGHGCFDEQEANYRQEMLGRLQQSACPTSSRSFSPGHFTASAFIVHVASQELLLIYHSKLHRWLQPGGHVERVDEDLFSAALREVREEVGLSLQRSHRLSLDENAAASPIFDLDVHRIPARKEMPAHLHYDVRFLFALTEKAAKAGSDAKDARWFPLDAIEDIESDESVLRAVRKIGALFADMKDRAGDIGAESVVSSCDT